MNRIYLDYAASTPLDKKVKEVMNVAEKFFGNPSSIHTEGENAKKIVEQSRQKIANVLGARSNEIIFTSGGTESNNLAILGIAKSFLESSKTSNTLPRGHIIVSKIEHSSTLEPCKQLEKWGFEITYLNVNENGLINLEEFKKSLRNNTILVSIIYANNEIGTIQPIREIGKIIKSHKPYVTSRLPYFHTDACQASNYLNIKVETLGVDSMTINASKIYGPKGIGILYKKSDVKIAPLIYGGGQENGIRSGTESPALCAGMAEALEMAQKNKNSESKRIIDLRDYFIENILSKISSAKLNGSAKNRLPNNANFSFRGCEAESLLIKLDLKSIACSSGSACASQSNEPSHVILALNNKVGEAKSSIRFSMGRQTNKKELNYVIKILCEILKN